MPIYIYKDVQEYVPTETTLLYCPFKEDLINVVWNASPSSQSNASIDWWVAHVNSWHIYYNLSTNVNTSGFTVCQWLKPKERRSYSMRVWMTSYLNQWLTRNDTWNIPRFWLVEWSSSRAASNWWEMPLNEWHCRVTTWNWSTPIVYKDGEPMTYSWVSTSSTYNVGQVWVNNQYDYYNWYISQFIIDNSIWTVDQAKEYYDMYKWNYS